MGIIFCLYESDGDVWLIVEDVVCELGFATSDKLATDNDPSFGKIDILTNLGQVIPSRVLDGWSNELCADIAFAKISFVHKALLRIILSSISMNKRGQFYIIAAVIIIVMIVGLTTIVNRGIASPKANSFYDLSKNFETESVKVVDYGIYNENSVGAIGQKLGDFYTNYSNYALATDPAISISFVYGNTTDAIYGVMNPEAVTTKLGEINVGKTNTYNLPAVYRTSGNKVSVNISGTVYDFTLAKEQGFYFIIAAKKGEETLVATKEA